jgi:hypothetical protein
MVRNYGFSRCFTRPPGTSTCNRSHGSTTSKPCRPRAMYGVILARTPGPTEIAGIAAQAWPVLKRLTLSPSTSNRHLVRIEAYVAFV